MQEIHSHGIIHHDLAIRNLMLDANRILKIIDFGCATFSNDGVCSEVPLVSNEHYSTLQNCSLHIFRFDRANISKTVDFPNDAQCSTAFDIYCCAIIYIRWVR